MKLSTAASFIGMGSRARRRVIPGRRPSSNNDDDRHANNNGLLPAAAARGEDNASDETGSATDNNNINNGGNESLTAAAAHGEDGASDDDVGFASANPILSRLSAASQQQQQEGGDDDDDEEDEEDEEINECPLSGEPPIDPVTIDDGNAVYGRQALLTYLQDYKGERYDDEFKQGIMTGERIHPVTGDRLARIMAERDRRGLPLPMAYADWRMDPSLHGSDDNEGHSSGDELLNVLVPGVRRQQIGSFLGADGGMRTAAHRLAWQSFIQIASNGEGGLRASLGHGRRRLYFQQYNTQLYSSDGPFASFARISAERTQRAVGAVIYAAKRYYDQGHSNADGDAHEDVPEWARIVFPLFDGNTQRDQDRRRHQAVVRGMVGAQATLGAHRATNGQRVQLRDETSRNGGDPALRQQLINHPIEWDEMLIEGRDDIAHPIRRQQGHRRRRRRTHHRNAHVEEYNLHHQADHNDAGTHYDDIQRGFGSLDRLVNGINQAMVQRPTRTAEEVYNHIRNLETERRTLHNQPELLQDNGIALSILREELRRLRDAMADETSGEEESSAD